MSLDSRYRTVTQAALWILFACGGGLFLAGLPLHVPFKLWVVASLGVAIALLAHLADETAYRRTANVLLVVLAASGVASAFEFLRQPFLPLCAGAALVASILAARRGGLPRLAAMGVVVLAAAFGLAEATLGSQRGSDDVVTEVRERSGGAWRRARGFSVPDAARGFAGRPDTEVRVRYRRSGELVYDALYTLDGRGRRVTPGSAPGAPNLVFLGDSFAFGEGVADHETAPAQLVARMPELRPLNLGFKGYGPHQALATLEAGLETDLIPLGANALGVYYATFDPGRAVGKALWDTTGPRYERTSDGRLVNRGPFSAHWQGRMLALAHRSHLLGRMIRGRAPSGSERDLFVALIERTDELFRERHGGPFLAVLWGEERDECLDEVASRLASRQIELRVVRNAAPGRAEVGPNRLLGDGHPSPSGQAHIATLIEDWVTRGVRAPNPEAP